MTGATPDPPAVAAPPSRLDILLNHLRKPVDGSSLAVFRIAFGVIAMIEVYRYFSNDWVNRYWVEPGLHLTYVGFGWVHPLPETGMYVLWALLAFAALGITLGVAYRASCLVFALGFSYSFLLDAGRYLNHFYLIALLAFLLACVPADRVWSLDVGTGRRSKKDRPIPAWSLWLLRFQIAVVYVYGAIAKLEPDWLRGEPMATWLARESDRALIGPLLVQDWMGPAMAWAGLGLDLLIVFAVAWRRTRIPALIAAGSFHLINNELFTIGVFPYLAFASLLLFCEPDWPRAIQRRVEGRTGRTPVVYEAPPPLTSPRDRKMATIALALAAVFVVAQLTVPLRHVFFPGRATWTEAGHNFSWHMKLRIKTGETYFVVVDPATRKAVAVNPTIELTYWQYEKMTTRPELIRQFAHHLARRYAEQGTPGVKVYARSTASLNNRPEQQFIDPDVDLAAQSPTLGTPSWVVPLMYPLP